MPMNVKSNFTLAAFENVKKGKRFKTELIATTNFIGRIFNVE